MRKQWVRSVFPTGKRPPKETKTPAKGATEAGAVRINSRRAAFSESYTGEGLRATIRRYTVSANLLVEVVS